MLELHFFVSRVMKSVTENVSYFVQVLCPRCVTIATLFLNFWQDPRKLLIILFSFKSSCTSFTFTGSFLSPTSITVSGVLMEESY